MKLILALALGATARFATPALRGGARRLEALELLGAEESAKVEAEQEAQRAKALEEAMAQLKQAQDMMAKAEASGSYRVCLSADPSAPADTGAGFGFDLTFCATKPVVRNGVDGVSPGAESADAMYYYSITRPHISPHLA